MRASFFVSLTLGIALVAGAAAAQAPQTAPAPAAAPAPLPYGMPIALADAKKAADAAIAEAGKTGFASAVAIVGPAGDLIYFARMDNANISTSWLAQKKAQTAATYRRPSKLFEDRVQTGSTYVLGLEGAMPVGGGVPLVIDGKIVGAIGASGAPSSGPDEQVAQAGAAALK
jgi:glc operon protein GlcG